jgi:hypothetical protein
MKALYKFCQAGVFCLTLLLMAPSLFSQNKRTLTAYPNTVVDSLIHGYWVSLPASYDTGSKQYPLLLFIHGAGELGPGDITSLNTLLNTGTLKQINLQINQGQNANFPDPCIVNGKSFEFIVVEPELRSWPQADSLQVLAVNDMLNLAIRDFRVDTTKMYLTGLSMGGGFSWNYAGYSGTSAKRLAAIVPVAGASIPNAQRADTMAKEHLPAWATHYAIDTFVSTNFTTGYIQMLNAASANPAPLITIYNQSGHGGWRQTYGDVNLPGCVNGKGQNVYVWMLQYRRQGDSVVLEPNVGPPPSSIFTVDAGPNLIADSPRNSIQIYGTDTVKNETVASFKWTEQCGPNTAAISGSGGLSPFVSNLVFTPTMKGLVQGVYVFQVAMISQSGKYRSSQMLVTVIPAPPGTFQANAGPDVTITLPTNSWKIQGQCIVKGATPASCHWKEVSGPSTATISGGGSVTPTVSNLIAGTYVFELDLVSTTGQTSSDQMNLTVNPATAAGSVIGNAISIGDSLNLSSGLRIYPNPVPADQELAVEAQVWPKGTVKFMVYDGAGRLVRVVTLENNAGYFRQTIPMTGLSRGSYILAVTMEGQKPRTFKFSIQ